MKLDLGRVKGEKGDTGATGATGAKGTDGREVEITRDDAYLKWRYVGETDWKYLAAIADFKGDKGDKGEVNADALNQVVGFHLNDTRAWICAWGDPELSATLALDAVRKDTRARLHFDNWQGMGYLHLYYTSDNEQTWNHIGEFLHTGNIQDYAAEKSHTHGTGDITSGTLPIARGGTGNTTGLAASAAKLATARTIRTNLASTSSVSFDGTANITPGVTGVLPIANGGTGATSLSALKTAMEALQISTGTYVGTGTYGMSNPNKLTFPFVPKLVFVENLVFMPTLSVAFVTHGSGSIAFNGLSGKTISWYSGRDDYYQYNHSGTTYSYLAIG